MLSLAGLGGCVYPAPVVVAPAPVPALVALPPPAGLYVWRPAHWRWNGDRYVLVPGHYVSRA